MIPSLRIRDEAQIISGLIEKREDPTSKDIDISEERIALYLCDEIALGTPD